MNNDELLTTLKNRFSGSDVELLSKLLFETAHPIGSYLFTNNLTSPNLYLVGGVESTWQRIGDRFLYAVTNDSDVDQVGGERNVTLNINQIPAHKHRIGKQVFMVSNPGAVFTINDSNFDALAATDNARADGGISCTEDQKNTIMDNAGGNQSHNNMPPWYGCVVWKRTS